MSWAARAQPIAVGDKVRYSSRWLISTSTYTGDLPQARGVVTEIRVLSPDVVLAVVDWSNPEIPEKINVKNLERLNTRGQLH